MTDYTEYRKIVGPCMTPLRCVEEPRLLPSQGASTPPALATWRPLTCPCLTPSPAPHLAFSLSWWVFTCPCPSSILHLALFSLPLFLISFLLFLPHLLFSFSSFFFLAYPWSSEFFSLLSSPLPFFLFSYLLIFHVVSSFSSSPFP